MNDPASADHASSTSMRKGHSLLFKHDTPKYNKEKATEKSVV
jgi:hypothetical protein